MSPPIALIQMPFAVTAWPALGLSLLGSGLKRRKIDSKVHYFNIEFQRMLGDEDYQALALGCPSNADLLGEWVFSEALWGSDKRKDNLYLDSVLGSTDRAHYERFGTKKLETHREQAIRARAKVCSFLDFCLDSVDWRNVQMAGFSSVFQQHVASLSLAKRLKQSFPNLYIIFGGGNCEDTMGPATLRNFPFVDAVCCGEGDIVFPEFAERFLTGGAVSVDGILTRSTGGPQQRGTAVNVPPVYDMDALPYPDYDDYFRQSGSLPATGTMPVRMMFETSRGCWWGQKHHCTFCGLNGIGMPFRHKSPERALEEITWLLDRYGAHTRKLSAADNIIPLEYFKSFLPRLEEMHLELDLFYETKANLTESQITQYKRSGLNQIQPGIESMNSTVLRLMRKGVSALQNIQLLKWCAQYGVSPYWNYLFGFPGETAESYSGQAEVLSSLTHLAPPVGCGPVRFDRFSPYHKNPAEFGINNLAPYPAYSFIYPGLDQQELLDLAYYFVGDFDGKQQIPSYTASIVDVISGWQKTRDEATLCHSAYEGRTTVFDGRSGEIRVLILDGVSSEILKLCGSITARRALYDQLSGSGYAMAQIDDALDQLLLRKLLIAEDGRFLTLSIELGHDYVPPEGALRQILAHLSLSDAAGGQNAVLIPAHLCTTIQ